MLKLHAVEEAVENVSGILRLYDLRMKTQNRMLTSRIIPTADVTEEVTTGTSSLTEKCEVQTGNQKVCMPPTSPVKIILFPLSFKRKVGKDNKGH